MLFLIDVQFIERTGYSLTRAYEWYGALAHVDELQQQQQQQQQNRINTTKKKRKQKQFDVKTVRYDMNFRFIGFAHFIGRRITVAHKSSNWIRSVVWYFSRVRTKTILSIDSIYVQADEWGLARCRRLVDCQTIKWNEFAAADAINAYIVIDWHKWGGDIGALVTFFF